VFSLPACKTVQVSKLIHLRMSFSFGRRDVAVVLTEFVAIFVVNDMYMTQMPPLNNINEQEKQ
jgi:hypothetical protein